MAKKTNTNRRDFLKITAAGAAGIALTSSVGTIFAKQAASIGKSPLNKWPGRVVVNFNKAAVTASSNSAAVPDVIKTMIDDSIKRLTEQTEIGAAWKAIFPDSLTATSKIAIKVNTLNSGSVAPHWSSVKAMTDGLQLMTVGGAAFPAANITIYDMNNGDNPSIDNLTLAGYKTENFPTIAILKDTAIDGTDGALGNRKYASTLKKADYLINVFGARGHDIPPAGSKFSMGFKSHYGTYFDANGMHDGLPDKMRSLNCTGPVYNKQVLNVCVGIFGTNEGRGPSNPADVFSTYSKKIDTSSTCQCPTTVVMSTDPISAEAQSIKILRMNKSASFAVADMPDYLKASAGIDVAGFTPTHNIGVIDEVQMDVRRIMNGQIIAVKDPAARLAMGGIMVSAHQIQGHSTFIDFTLPKDHFGNQAQLEIFDAKGSLTRLFSQKVMGIRNNVSWDEKDAMGNKVAKGMYVVRLTSGIVRASSQFSIVR
jgi:hypothetical protein